jgi:hypothetical protein
MESDRPIKAYVASLEQAVKNGHLWLKEALDEFEEKVRRVGPERNVSHSMITDIRKTYKDIQDLLTRIKGVQQLLQGKYRQHYRRDAVRDNEILELGFVAKNCYFRFESVLEEREARKRLREKEGFLARPLAERPIRWFYSPEHQDKLLQNLRELGSLGHRVPPTAGGREQRKTAKESPRSVSLFILSGDEQFMDGLQSRMRLRAYDISERSGRRELRGALTHLKETSASDIVNVFRRFMGEEAFSRLKCLFIPIQSPKDLERKELNSAEKLLQAMARGEVRRISGLGPADTLRPWAADRAKDMGNTRRSE